MIEEANKMEDNGQSDDEHKEQVQVQEVPSIKKQ